MALVNCPECEQEVSDAAHACPRCGYPVAESLRPTPMMGVNMPFGPYSWRVLSIEDGKALLITEDIIELWAYNDERGDTTWETCTLRRHLNGEFMCRFSISEQARIVQSYIKNSDNLWYGTSGGNDTTDKVFLLSLEEVDRYFGDSKDYLGKLRKGNEDGNLIPSSDGWLLSNSQNHKRIAIFNRKPRWWWLRSPGTIHRNVARNVAIVRHDGCVNVGGRHGLIGCFGVRPALWLSL